MESSGFIIVSGMKSSTPALFKSQPFPFQMASKGKKKPECSRMFCWLTDDLPGQFPALQPLPPSANHVKQTPVSCKP